MIGGAIRFDFFVTIGEFFRPWGWGYCGFDWDSHVVMINNAPWRRTWINRHEYVHPYEVRQYRAEERLPERHVLHERTKHERTARAKDATTWKSTAITARANLLSGQKVLDALKQATKRAK